MTTEFHYDVCLAIERGLEPSRTLVLCLSSAALGSDWVGLACPAEAAERRRKRSTVLFRHPANAGRRFVPRLLPPDRSLTGRRGIGE